MARAAATGSSAWKIALPATRMSAPAATACAPVSGLIPPSISSSTGEAALVDDAAGLGELVEHLGDECLPAEAREARS